MTEPTDAELDELRQANSGRLNFVTLSEFRTIARAVLEKWGTPAGAGEVVACGNCGGTGWMVRDPDIGTDQECFVCNGSGFYSESATPQPTQAQEPVAIIEHTLGGSIQYCPLGTAYKLPMGVQFNLYTVPQPLPTSQGDAQIAPADVLLRTAIAETLYRQVRIEYDNRIGPWSAFDVLEQQRIVDSIQGLCSVFAPASQGDALDAARYRWLRHGDNDEKVLKTYTSRPSKPGEPTMFLPRNDELDRLIDAARAAQEGNSHD